MLKYIFWNYPVLSHLSGTTPWTCNRRFISPGFVTLGLNWSPWFTSRFALDLHSLSQQRVLANYPFSNVMKVHFKTSDSFENKIPGLMIIHLHVVLVGKKSAYVFRRNPPTTNSHYNFYKQSTFQHELHSLWHTHTICES